MANSEIRAYYSGQNFFITGGTGLVGMCLLEKILRSLPDVGTIYLLMRQKKGKKIEERLEDIKRNPLFETVLQNNKHVFNKVIPVSGAVEESNLGLSVTDRKMVEDANIIVHSAAVVDFELDLKSLKSNVDGTREVLELASELKRLKAIIHVSSASVGMFHQEPKEILYNIPENVEEIVTLVRTLSKEELALKEPTLLKSHGTFYALTKHMAELEIAKYAHKFPCTIVRPSMILTTWKEPVRGWTCSRAGIIGFLTGVSLGIIRRLPFIRENIIDCIPVDIVANQLLVAGWNATQELSIYHCTSSTQKPYRWFIMEDVLQKMLHKYPSKSALWHPTLKVIRSLFLFKISDIFVHYIPARVLDIVLRLNGYRPVLPKLEKAWNIFRRCMRYFLSEWKFCNANTIALAEKMNETDRKLFYIDISDIDWEIYTIEMFLGIRKYLFCEDDTTLLAARSRDNMLLMLYIIWHVLFLTVLWCVVAYLSGLTMMQCAGCVPVLYMLYSIL